MNEQAVRRFCDEREEEDCCRCCREQPRCRGRCRYELKNLLNNFLIFNALNDLTDDVARRMVGG